jgi:hypothetical protein
MSASMITLVLMALDTMAFQPRPQYTTRMKGTSQLLFQYGRDDFPDRVTVVECYVASTKESLERIEKLISKLDTKLDTKISKLATKESLERIETLISKLDTKLDTKISKLDTYITVIG